MLQIYYDRENADHFVIPANQNFDFYDENKTKVISVRYLQNKQLVKKLYYELETKEVQKSFATTLRTSGLKTTSFLFGFKPRNPLRRDFCHKAVSKKHNKLEQILEIVRTELEGIYKTEYPEIYKNHFQLASKILQEWRFPNSCFSSGIINKNNELKVHKDNGNIPDCFSNMLVIKNRSRGGGLFIQDYDFTIELDTGAIVIFNGQKIAHGVEKILNDVADSVRYSIVFYTLRELWNCLPVKEEVKRHSIEREVKEKRKLKILQLPNSIKTVYINTKDLKQRKKILEDYDKI
jgi:Oxygenase domain of the 2OGFeDO superfamily